MNNFLNQTLFVALAATFLQFPYAATAAAAGPAAAAASEAGCWTGTAWDESGISDRLAIEAR